MSQPKRYDFGMTVESCPTTGFHETRPWVYETEHGMYVKHADYAALQAENERLRKYWKATGEGVNKYVGKSLELEDKVAALQAENEKYRRVFQGEAGWTLVEPNHLAALQAENERLKDELIGYHKECDRLYEQAIDQQMAANVFENNGIILQAENERLRKAGDAMENELFRVILMELPGLEKEDINNQYIADWRAAKGVQP